MTDKSPTWHCWLQESSVQEYLRGGDLNMPGRREQLGVMLSLIPFAPDDPIQVLDLGCGDGILLDTILHAFPNTKQAVAVDGSPLMLGRAAERLQKSDRSVDFVAADLGAVGWLDRLPQKTQFQVVVSGFAIHHLEDEQKRRLYGEIYHLLAAPGIFINIEHVKSHGSRGEQLFESWYVGHLIELERASGGQRMAEELASGFMNRPGKAVNRLAAVEDQLQWLRDAGFQEVDCYWKCYELALFAGEKIGKST